MSNEHIDLESLSAFADGDLNAVSALRVERHLAACTDCRRSLERVRSLVATAASLPRDVAPPPEAWAGISSRKPRAESREPRWWHNGWLAAAAAVLLVAGTATVMLLAVNTDKSTDMARGRVNATPAVLAVERNYAPTLVELRDAFESQRLSLAPATVRTLDHSLAVIDSAIVEARAALAADPASASLTEILSGYYQRKIDFLKRANAVGSSL